MKRKPEMKFAIYQIRYTDQDILDINNGNKNAKREIKACIDFNFRNEELATIAHRAAVAGMYDHVANITAKDLDDVFAVGNLGPEENIERLDRMHSISVGDCIVDEDGYSWVVAPMGFQGVAVQPINELDQSFEYNLDHLAKAS
jgi:hypothetical protein